MNKEKIVEELNEWIDEEFGTRYTCISDTGDLTLALCRNDKIYCYVAWFKHFRSDKFYFESGGSDSKINIQLIEDDVIRKFYDKAIELMDKYGDKYTVQVFPQDKGYLHVNHESETSHDVTYDIGWPEDMYHLTQTEFTKSEIEELKKRGDVAIDWNKALIKEVDN